jgi:outer membrane protein assembly factor BamB
MKLKLFLILIAGMFFSVNSVFAQKNFQWGGPDRNCIYPENNLLIKWPENGPKLIWGYDSLGIGYSSPAVVDDCIYITGLVDSTGYLYAFNHSGKLLWKKAYGKEWKKDYPGTRSTPLIYDGLGYVYSGTGIIYCFDLKNRNIKWTVDLFKQYGSKEVRFGMAENMLIYEDKLYCTPGGEETNIIAINRKTGELIWKSKGLGEPSGYCSPLIVDHNHKKYLITITAKSIISLDPNTGNLYWGLNTNIDYPHGIHGNIPVYNNGYLFAMNGWGYGSAMFKIAQDGNSAKQVWKSKYHDLEHGNVILMGNTIYGSDYTSKKFICTDWETGAVLDSINDLSPSTVVAANGLIYCFTYNGELALLKPTAKSIEVISRFSVPGKKRNDHIATTVINKGKMYIRYDKSLWVYDIKE